MSAQTIFRNGSPSKPYAHIMNSCLQDDDLKAGPAWVLLLCLSMPRSWRVSVEWVARKRGMNVGTVREHVRTLEALGYCKRMRLRNSDGSFGPYAFAFTDQPHRFGDDDDLSQPATEKPSLAQPSLAKPTPIKKKPNQRTNKHKKAPIQRACANSPEVEGLDDDFVDDGLGEAQLIAEAQAAAKSAAAALPDLGLKPRRLEKLPFAAAVVDRIHRMGLDVPELIAEYRAEVGKRTIANPDGYLLGMARKRVAKRDGIAAAEVDAVYSTDPETRARAYAALAGAPPEPQWKGARARQSAGHGPQRVGSHLLAALANRGRA